MLAYFIYYGYVVGKIVAFVFWIDFKEKIF